MDGYINIISTLGFPIAVSLWFMFRVERQMQNNTEALNSLKSVIKTLLRER